MLQAVSSVHDHHFEHHTAHSTASLAAARNDGKKHLLLAATGAGPDAIHIPNIVKALAHHADLSIRIVLTNNAKRFLAGQSKEQPTVEGLRALPNVDAVYDDASEWEEPWKRGKAILHIELRR